MLRVKIIMIIIIFNTCSHSQEKTFKKINYDWSRDYIKEIAENFNPTNTDSWALVRCWHSKNINKKIIFKTEKFNTKIIEPISSKGFYTTGHPSTRYYYIISVKEGIISYVDNNQTLINFLGKIDTKEEALILAKIKGFLIDYENPEGSSYKKTKNKYHFLLMQNEGKFTGKRQYLVEVDNKGRITSKQREVYCKPSQKCFRE